MEPIQTTSVYSGLAFPSRERSHSSAEKQMNETFGEGRPEKGCCKMVPRQSPTQLRISVPNQEVNSHVGNLNNTHLMRRLPRKILVELSLALFIWNGYAK